MPPPLPLEAAATAVKRLAVALLLAALVAQPAAAQAQYSNTWGVNGELWRPTGRLSDWSYAGYMAGDRAIPSYPVGVTVTDRRFAGGAKGDGRTDDTEAFVQAIRAASALALNLTTRVPHTGFQNGGTAGVAVYVPPGRYVIRRMLEITQSNVVVRGAGPGQTTLYFPASLMQLYGPIVEWQFSGGFLNILGTERNSTHTSFKQAQLTASAARGARRLQVSSTKGIAVGQWVRLWVQQPLRPTASRRLLSEQGVVAGGAGRRLLQGRSGGANATAAGRYLPLSKAAATAQFSYASEAEHSDNDGSGSGAAPQGPVVASAGGTLDAHLYAENAVDSGSAPFPLERTRFASRVVAVGAGWIELERPLLHDLRAGWQVGVYKFEQTVQHSGWESMTVEFPHTLTRTHFDVDGWNGVYMAFTANCWARNMRILNADQGAEAFNSDFITFASIVLDVTAPRTGPGAPKNTNGHHGMWTAASSNVLFTQFDIRTTFIHDLTLDVWAHECVFSNGKGTNLNMDMHRGGPHHNLWTNLDVGKGTRPFASGGNASRGAHAARLNTWWNIYSSLASVSTLKLPDCGFGALQDFIGAFGAPPGGVAAGRNVRYPGWCVAAPLGWYAELPANRAKTFSPPDLHTAMVLTRWQRLAATAKRA